LDKQAIAAADDTFEWQSMLKARIDKEARRRKVATWCLPQLPLS
jgi:hypothetical protein